jgi:hypothetical protein
MADEVTVKAHKEAGSDEYTIVISGLVHEEMASLMQLLGMVSEGIFGVPVNDKDVHLKLDGKEVEF